MELIDFPRRKAGYYMAATVLLISLSVMIAWWVAYQPLLNIIPGTGKMEFNTALGFTLSALAIFIALQESKRKRYLQIGLALLVLLLGVSSLLQQLLGTNLAINNLLVKDTLSLTSPGLMSPATGLCFTLTGCGILILTTHRRKWVKIFNQYVLHLVSAIALVSLFAYIMQVPVDDRIFFIRTMAIHTSICFLLVSVSLSLVHPYHGLTSLLMGKNAGSQMIRQLFPFVVLLPFVLGFILISLSDEGLIDETFALLLLVSLLIILSIVYISFVAQSLNKTDEQQLALQQSLRKSNMSLRRYKEALDKSFIISVTDTKGNIKHVNNNFCKISGYQRHELLGQNHRLVKSNHHSSAFFQYMWTAIRQGKVWSGEIQNQAKNGSFYWVYTVIVPFKNEKNKVYEYVSIRYDITEQKEAEQQRMTQYIQHLENKNLELEQFAYIASHDLQEPLRTVTNFSNVLYQKYEDKLDSQGQKSLKFILNATQRMRMLISGLLIYSRIGRKREREPVDLNEQIQVVLEDMQTLINEKQVRVELGTLPTVPANALEMRILFQNLISNAIKYQPDGQVPEVKIFAKEEELHWKISVIDNGIGLDEEYQEKVFMIFQRLHSQDKYQGNGIGLAHCRKIIELHGGKIWADTTPDKGSIFNLTIAKSQQDVLPSLKSTKNQIA